MEYNTYAMTSKAALAKYLHQTAFIPPKQTLLKAIEINIYNMDQLHSTGSPKISPAIGPSDTQNSHKETKTENQKYQR